MPSKYLAQFSVIEFPMNTTRFSPGAGAESAAFASRYFCRDAQSLRRRSSSGVGAAPAAVWALSGERSGPSTVARIRIRDEGWATVAMSGRFPVQVVEGVR